MLGRICVKAFQTMNLTVGASSLAAIAVGALTVFGSSGLLCLEKAGVKTIPEKRIEQILHLGMGSIFLGTVGFVSATVAGASIATLLNTVNRDDEEEPLASSNNNSVVFESSENIPTVESISTKDNTESLYLYQIMQLNSCSHFETKFLFHLVYNRSILSASVSVAHHSLTRRATTF
ncbi:MAG: hypothetical protein WBA39_01235 [Rivularia sp. (in: cyanobacteria)]